MSAPERSDAEALDAIAHAVRPWGGMWDDPYSALEQIGNLVESTGRPVQRTSHLLHRGTVMSELNTDYIRGLHPDWEVVTALCEEVDNLRADHSVQLRRLNAALTELTHHGDLTPAGKRKLEQIIRGEQ